MSSQTEQRNTQQNQNTGMYPTNSQVGGPGALGSGPAQNDDQNRFNNSNTNDPSHQQTQQQQMPPPPVHPDRAGQGHVQDATAFGAGNHAVDQSSVRNDTGGTGATYDSGDASYGGKRDVQYGEGRGVPSSTNDQYANQDQPQQHTLDRRGHRAPGAKAAHTAEADAAYEGGKLAHGGQHDAGATGATGQATSGPGQHGDFGTNQHQGVGAGDFDSGGHTGARAAEGATAYEAGKLTHDHGQGVGGQHGLEGQTAGHQAGSGAYDANPNVPTGTRPAGQFETGTGAAGAHGANPNLPAGTRTTGTGTGGVGGGPGAVPPDGAGGRVHPTGGTYAGQRAGYTSQQTTGTGTATGATAGTTGTGASSTGSGFSGVGKATGQANIILGKLQQAGGALRSDNAMKAKGLEREAKGVARVDQQEAKRLEGMAGARREKAGGVHTHGEPQPAANAGVDPTVGTRGRNL